MSRPVLVSLNETQLKAQIVKRLRALGYHVYVTSERRRGYSKMPTGLPDLFVLHVGRKFAAWIEVKRPGQSLHLAQRGFQAAVTAAGYAHYVMDDVAQLNDWARFVCR